MSASGSGWSVKTLDEMGEGPGFRKVRTELGVEAFGANAIVLPSGIQTSSHWHERQDELYFVHAGTIEMAFDDGEWTELGPGACAHVAAATRRRVRNVSGAEATYLIVGAADGYVGRDGQGVPGEPRLSPVD